MGGDFSPANELLGAAQALNEDKNIDLLLTGDKKIIQRTLSENSINIDEKAIVHCSEVITMHDSPMAAIKAKRDSSIVVGAKLVKEGKADAFVSAGNTGAVSAVSTLEIGRIPGVSRPTIMAGFPNEKGEFTFVADVGAFVDSRPEHLRDFALLGSIFIEEIYGIEKPKVGLLNVGEERSKGYRLTTETARLLSETNLNFTGNVEGKDILKGTVDLVVCDGFVGNILLKFAESIIPFLRSSLKRYSEAGLYHKLRAGLVRTPLKTSLENADYQKHGGVPMLGVKGITIIGHGSSSPLAIKNMILRAKEMYDKQLIRKFEESLKSYA